MDQEAKLATARARSDGARFVDFAVGAGGEAAAPAGRSWWLESRGGGAWLAWEIGGVCLNAVESSRCTSNWKGGPPVVPMIGRPRHGRLRSRTVANHFQP